MTYTYFLFMILLLVLITRIFKDERVINIGLFLTLFVTLLMEFSIDEPESLVLVPILLVPAFMTRTNIKSKVVEDRSYIKYAFFFFFIFLIILSLSKHSESIALAASESYSLVIFSKVEIKHILICIHLLIVTVIIKNELIQRKGI